MHLAVGILRVPEGLDYSSIVEEEDQMQSQQMLDIMNKERTLRRNVSDSQLSIDSCTSSESVSPTPPQIPINEKLVDGTPNSLPGVVAGRLISDAPTGKKKNKKRRQSISALYSGPGGVPLPRSTLQNLTQFARKQKKSTIDVWWLYDDGKEVNLTILL